MTLDANVLDDSYYQCAQRLLRIFDDDRFAELNVPHWVTRGNACTEHPYPKAFTVQRFFAAIFTVTEDLGLHSGKEYAAAQVCACEPKSMPGQTREEWDALVAKNLSDLASTWVAYMFWPCAIIITSLSLALLMFVFSSSLLRQLATL